MNRDLVMYVLQAARTNVLPVKLPPLKPAAARFKGGYEPTISLQTPQSHCNCCSRHGVRVAAAVDQFTRPALRVADVTRQSVTI